MRKKKNTTRRDKTLLSERDDKWEAIRNSLLNEKEDDHRRWSISMKSEKDKISWISDKSNKIR